MPKAGASLQNIAIAILRLVKRVKDLKPVVCDETDCDAPAYPKRAITPLREL